MTKNLVILLTLVFLAACNDEVKNRFAPQATALGRLNDVVVVADPVLWESIAGDTFRFYYESAFPVMPRPEPLFDLRFFTPEDLEAEPLRRELRTYVILANLNDQSSPTTKMVRRDLGEEKFMKALADTSYYSTAGQDKWARGQMLAYVFGSNMDDLVRAIHKSFPTIAKRIRQHDEKQLAANIYTLQKENVSLRERIKAGFDIELNIPGDYQELEKDNFLLLKKDQPEYAQTIVIRKFPYTSAEQFDKEAIIRLRNEYGKEFISGASDNSYMVTNDRDLPVYDYTYNIDGSYVKEIRGIWELENEFIGGPFITYLIHNEAKQTVVFIDAFMYAPGKDKRDKMQELEYIVKNARLIKS